MRNGKYRQAIRKNGLFLGTLQRQNRRRRRHTLIYRLDCACAEYNGRKFLIPNTHRAFLSCCIVFLNFLTRFHFLFPLFIFLSHIYLFEYRCFSVLLSCFIRQIINSKPLLCNVAINERVRLRPQPTSPNVALHHIILSSVPSLNKRLNQA